MQTRYLERLALETYGIVSRVNIAITTLITLKIITKQLGLPLTLLIVCTNLYSLYKCLLNFSTTNKKRLIINIIALRKLYKR
jgi:hypothetical protein